MATAPDTLRPKLEALLRFHNQIARRQFPKVGTEEHPTPWDKAHKLIDSVLYDWEATR